MLGIIALAVLAGRDAPAQRTDPAIDSFPHAVRLIAIGTNVRLEVVDWGGSGRPVVLLAGLGDDAHVLDGFVSQLASIYHCYAITRRGTGASSAPPPTPANYGADRLGDDVLAVMDSLRLNRPVLIGHSIAGEELSSVGSRRPERVAGLIYMDAVWPYSYYDRSVGNMRLDALELKRELDELLSSVTRSQREAAEELRTELPHFEKVLDGFRAQLASYPRSSPTTVQPPAPTTMADAIGLGWQKYTDLHVPILALVAMPTDSAGPGNALRSQSAASLEAGVPSARVVRIPDANHYVFNSNRPQVLREIEAFIATVPR
jgi:pimeloyl-ACP methyl ester carboxylesterase